MVLLWPRSLGLPKSVVCWEASGRVLEKCLGNPGLAVGCWVTHWGSEQIQGAGFSAICSLRLLSLGLGAYCLLACWGPLTGWGGPCATSSLRVGALLPPYVLLWPAMLQAPWYPGSITRLLPGCGMVWSQPPCYLPPTSSVKLSYLHTHMYVCTQTGTDKIYNLLKTRLF